MVTNESVQKNKSCLLPEKIFGHPKGYYILLALVSFCFVVLKFAMPIIFDGSFIDEYLHSVGGEYFFEHSKLPQYYIDQATYNRGSYVTVLSGLLSHFFSRSVFSFKLVPIAIGVMNFFLLMFLAHNTLKKKSYVLLLLIIYTISPWVIFNHFYLRMYVFYELFLLLNLTIAQVLITFCEQSKKWHLLGGVLFLLCLCAAQLQLSNDNGAYLPVLAGGIALAYIFITCSHLFQFERKNIISKICCANIFLKGAVISIFMILGYFLFSGHDKLLFLFKTKLQWTSANGLKYNYLFFKRNLTETLFFLLSGISLLALKNKKKQMMVLIGMILFAIHISSSPDLQITRGIFYFLPLYYLISLISIDKITYFSDKIFKTAIYGAFIYTTILNYPSRFTEIPYIPSEIYYIDYAKVYSSVQQHCSDKTIVEASPSPFISSYYNVNVDYVLSETGWIAREGTYYYNKKERRFKTVFNDTPVLSNLNTLSNSDNGVCLIVRNQSRGQFVSEKTLHSLSRQQKPIKFINIELYISPKSSSPRKKKM